MVVLSLEQYAALTDEIKLKLDEADKAAAGDSTRYSEDEVFNRVSNRRSYGSSQNCLQQT